MVSPATAQEKSRCVYDALRTLKGTFPFSAGYKTSFSLAREGFELTFQNKTKVFLTAQTSVKGCPAGHCKVSTHLLVCNGPVAETTRRCVLDASERFKNFTGSSSGRINIVFSSSGRLVPSIRQRHPRDYYYFTSDIDPDIFTQRILSDIREYFYPMLEAFVEDYDKGLEMVLDSDFLSQATVERPFTTALALLKLTGREREVGRLLEAAESNDAYYDYHQLGDAAQEYASYFAVGL